MITPIQWRFPNAFAFDPDSGELVSSATWESSPNTIEVDVGPIVGTFENPPDSILTVGKESVLGVSVVHHKFLFLQWKRSALNALLRDKSGAIVAEIDNGHWHVGEKWSLENSGDHFKVKDKYGQDYIEIDIKDFGHISVRGKFYTNGIPSELSDCQTDVGIGVSPHPFRLLTGPTGCDGPKQSLTLKNPGYVLIYLPDV